MTIPAPLAAARPAAGAPQEQELKLRLRAQDVAALRARLDRLAPERSERVDSTYFDTPDLRLARARAALRLRALGSGGRRRWVQTFKTGDSAAAFSRRGEWESPVRAGRIELARLADSPLAQVLGSALPAAGAGASGLSAVFRTCFDRSTWEIELAGSRIEVAIDRGLIEAAGRRETIEEAELELRSGGAAAVWQLALQLCRGGSRRADLCLLPYGDSKAARGYRLARGAALPVPPALVPPLDPGGDTAAAARVLVEQGLTTVLALAATLGVEAPDPEFVHQARVALRRLRAGLALLEADVPAWLPLGLRRWSRCLGQVRDWDVACEQWLPALAAAAPSALAGPWARVLAAAARRRDAARARLTAQLQTPAFAEFALRALQWSATPARLPGRPLAAVAAPRVQRRLRRVAAVGARFAGLDAKGQHQARLQAKALRYAIELLAPCLPPALAQAPLRAVARFQEAAGRAHDAVVLQAAIARLTRSPRLRAAAAAWAAPRHDKAAQRVERAAAKLAQRQRAARRLSA